MVEMSPPENNLTRNNNRPALVVFDEMSAFPLSEQNSGCERATISRRLWSWSQTFRSWATKMRNESAPITC